MPVTIQDPRSIPRPPIVTFDYTPKSAVDSINIGGDSFPWVVNQPVNGAPAQASHYRIDTDVAITFTADVETYEDDFITEYEWSFGDGHKGYGVEVIHTYRTFSPQLRVSLCVTDNRFRKVCVGQQIAIQKGNLITVGLP